MFFVDLLLSSFLQCCGFRLGGASCGKQNVVALGLAAQSVVKKCCGFKCCAINCGRQLVVMFGLTAQTVVNNMLWS